MENVLAALAGLVVGAVGFLPLWASLHLAKRATRSSSIGKLGIGVIGILISFAFLAVAAYLCISFARPVTLAFCLFQAIGLSISAVSYGMVKMTR